MLTYIALLGSHPASLFAAQIEQDQASKPQLEVVVSQVGQSSGGNVKLQISIINESSTEIYVSQNVEIGAHLTIEFQDGSGAKVGHNRQSLVAWKDETLGKPRTIGLFNGRFVGMQRTYILTKPAKDVRVRARYSYHADIVIPKIPRLTEQPLAFKGDLESAWVKLK